MGDNSDIFELDIPYLSISHEGHSGHNQISFVTTHQQINHHQLFQDLKREAQPCSTSLEDQRVLVNSRAGESPMCYARNTAGTNFSAISQPLPVPEYTLLTMPKGNCLNGQSNVARYDGGYTNQSSNQNFNPVSQATRSFQNGLRSITDILPSFGSSFIHQTSAIIDSISADLTNLESLPRKQSLPVSSTHPTTVGGSYDNSTLAPSTTHCAVSENEIQSIINANISLLSTWQKQLEAMSSFYTKNILPKTPAPTAAAAPVTVTNSSSVVSTQHGLSSEQNLTVPNDHYNIFKNISQLLGSGNESFDNGPTADNILDLFAKMNNANLLPQPNSNAAASHTGEIPQNNNRELVSSLKAKPESPEIKRSSSCSSDKRGNPVPSGMAVCSFCGKAFKFKSNLHTHVKAVHKKIKPHTCPVCGKTFSLKQNMKTHAKNIHLRVTAHSPTPSTIEQEPTQFQNGCDSDDNLFAANRVKLEQLQTSFPPVSYLERVSTVNNNNTFSSLEDQYRNLLLSAAAAQVAIFGCPDPITNSTTQLFHNNYGGEEGALNDISPSLREEHVGMAIAAVANQTYVPPICRAKKKLKMASPCSAPKSTDLHHDSNPFPTNNDIDQGTDVKLFDPTSPPFPTPPLKSTPEGENSDLRSSGENIPRPVGAPRRNVTDSRDLIYCPQCPKTFTLKGNFNVHHKIVHEKVREFSCPFCSKRFGLKANMYMHVANVHKMRGAGLTSPQNNYTNASPTSSSKRDRSSLKISQSIPGGDNSMSAGSLSDSQSNSDPQFYKANDEESKMANLVLGPENTDNMLAVASVYLQYLQQQQFNLDKGSVDNKNNQNTTQKSNTSSLHHDPSLLSSHNDRPSREDDHYHQDDDCRNDEYRAYGESGVQQSKHINDINDANCGRLIASTLNTLHDRRTSAI